MSAFTGERITNALFVISKNVGLQFIGCIGLLFFSGLALTWISRWTNNSFRQFVFPRFGLYIFGVIGIPAHEFCHAFFAKVFFHSIDSIKWFDPRAKGGSYGTVVHCYNERNIYQRIGLFFIGMGPVLLAPVFLFLLYMFLIPAPISFHIFSSDPIFLARELSTSLFLSHNWTSLGFYAFIYFALCLTSQMELSPDDFKVARGGVLPFLAILMIMNVAAFVTNFNLHAKLVTMFTTGFAMWATFFAMAIFFSVLNLVLCVVLLNVVNRLFGRGAINPFQS